ncbi:MAG: cobalamin biosynthesis protein [Thermoguttaceae bacterium]|jgi:cobalt-precorrin 5A hydrolase
MKLAVISLSDAGARLAARLAAALDGSELFLHADVGEMPQARRFHRILDLTRELFARCEGLVYIAPAGVVVRAVAPVIEHKTRDPAVVVVDVLGRWAVSLLGGHEAGANRLAFDVANVLGAEPVISTTTEAVKDLIVGVGCRCGTPPEAILAAVRDALAAAGGTLDSVRLLASADLKAEEPGLLEAARQLGLPLRLIPSQEIRETILAFERSEFVDEKVHLPAVAEPAALLAGRRTRLILPKQILHGVTVAIARESST